MAYTYTVFLLAGCLSIVLVLSQPQTRKKLRVKTNTEGDNMEQLAPRHRRRLGFWERYYNDYITRGENILPSRTANSIVSNPRLLQLLKTTLKHRALDYNTLPSHVQQYMDEHMEQHFAELSHDYFQRYRTYDEMIGYMRQLVVRCKGHCELINLGYSYEGRPTIGIKITTHGKGGPNKPKIWLDAGIHAREWVAHSSAVYVLDMLIEQYDNEPYVRNLVDNYEWYIFPCVNPDGFNYTWTTDRMWRKTRSINPESQCVGVDPNRNFDYKWGRIGISRNPCSNNYGGPRPFSEVETRNIRDFILAQNGTWLAFFTIHSRSQMVMWPWGYTSSDIGDYRELQRVGRAISSKMSSTYNLYYRYGSAARILYMSSGTSRDWARGVARIKYVFTIEMRDKKTWELPPKQIIPAGQELWNGLVGGMRAIESRLDTDSDYIPLGPRTTISPPSTPIDYVRKYSRGIRGW